MYVYIVNYQINFYLQTNNICYIINKINYYSVINNILKTNLFLLYYTYFKVNTDLFIIINMLLFFTIILIIFFFNNLISIKFLHAHYSTLNGLKKSLIFKQQNINYQKYSFNLIKIV